MVEIIKAFLEADWKAELCALLALLSIVSLLNAIVFRLPNRLIRHLNIRARGWPPSHLDADGDFKEEDKDEPDQAR